MANARRVPILVVGVFAAVVAAYGLWYNLMTLCIGLVGGFPDLVVEQQLNHFFQAFYIMSAVCIACYVLLLVIAADLLRQNLRWFRFLTVLLMFEVLYFISIGFLWRSPAIGQSVAAATGVANGGLTLQFVSLFSIWDRFFYGVKGADQ